MKPTTLSTHLAAHLEQVGNDACNAEDDQLWAAYNAIRVTIAYLRGEQLPSPEPAPWKGQS